MSDLGVKALHLYSSSEVPRKKTLSSRQKNRGSKETRDSQKGLFAESRKGGRVDVSKQYVCPLKPLKPKEAKLGKGGGKSLYFPIII